MTPTGGDLILNGSQNLLHVLISGAALFSFFNVSSCIASRTDSLQKQNQGSAKLAQIVSRLNEFTTLSQSGQIGLAASRESALLIVEDDKHLHIADLKNETGERFELPGEPAALAFGPGVLFVSLPQQAQIATLTATSAADDTGLSVTTTDVFCRSLGRIHFVRGSLIAHCRSDRTLRTFEWNGKSIVERSEGKYPLPSGSVQIFRGSYDGASTLVASPSGILSLKWNAETGKWALVTQRNLQQPRESKETSVGNVFCVAAREEGALMGYQQVRNKHSLKASDTLQFGYASVDEDNPFFQTLFNGPGAPRFGQVDGTRPLGCVDLHHDSNSKRTLALFTNSSQLVAFDANGGVSDQIRVNVGATGFVSDVSTGRTIVNSAAGTVVSVVTWSQDKSQPSSLREFELQRSQKNAQRLMNTGRKLTLTSIDNVMSQAFNVACDSCHPNGSDDGLNWSINVKEIPIKLRKTPPLWGLKPVAQSLYHFDGDALGLGQPTNDTVRLDLISNTIRHLMGGSAVGVDTAAIEHYVATRTPPLANFEDMKARQKSDVELFEAGEAAFEKAECGTCHSGGRQGTDWSVHPIDLLPNPNANSTEHKNALLKRGASVRTTPLRGLVLRQLFLHDGRATSLEAVFDKFTPTPSQQSPDLTQHGTFSSLSDEEKKALIYYLKMYF